MSYTEIVRKKVPYCLDDNNSRTIWCNNTRCKVRGYCGFTKTHLITGK